MKLDSEIIKEFGDFYIEKILPRINGDTVGIGDMIRDFILSLRHADRESLREGIEKMKEGVFPHTALSLQALTKEWNRAITAVQKLLEP